MSMSMMTRPRLNKKFLLSLVVAIGLSLPMPSWALSNLVQIVGELIFKIIMSPFYLLLQIEVWLLVILAQYNKFTLEDGVIVGWTAMRDLANMFFILILLIISFATIIRAQGYGYKQTLSRLIIVAILINFSRTIVGLFIDFSQVIMLTFVRSFEQVAAGNLIVALGLAKVTSAGDNAMSDTTYIQALFLGAFMLMLSVVVIGAFIGILAARIIKLWILTIMSPLAFLAYVLPKTQGFFNKWSSDLGKNLFSGPTLAFFLWLTFVITARGDINKTFLEDKPIGEDAAINQVSSAATPQNVINYVIALAMLAGSLQIVAASGAAGASIAGKASKFVNDKASQMARRYPLATASRAGALASSAFVDSNGNARKLFGVMSWNKIPFAGGRVQRAAQKMQGYDAARREQEQKEELKYIKPTHQQAFYESQATLGVGKGKVAKFLGRAYSTIGSQGGNLDKDVSLAQIRFDRGDYDPEDHDDIKRMAGHFRQTGDEKRLGALQVKHTAAYANDDEIKRRINMVGVDGVIKNLDPSGLGDRHNNPSEATERFINVVMGDRDIDGPGVRKLALSLGKRGRATLGVAVHNFNQTQKQNADSVNREAGKLEKNSNNILQSDEQGQLGFDQKNVLEFDVGAQELKGIVALGGMYPNMVVDDFYALLARIDRTLLKLKPEDILSHIEQRPNESKGDFDKRKAETEQKVAQARAEKDEKRRDALFRSAAGLDKPDDANDLLKKSLLVEMADGMDYSRWHELDLGDTKQKSFAKDLVSVATSEQLVQAFKTNTRAQNEQLAELILEVGKVVPKAMLDQMSPDKKKEYGERMNARSDNYWHGGPSAGGNTAGKGAKKSSGAGPQMF